MRLAADVANKGVDTAIYCLLSMFSQEEVPFVEEIIEKGSFRSLLATTPGNVPSGWAEGDPDSPF
jgi:hypothetical protein